jgi:signal transduction histidine kinase
MGYQAGETIFSRIKAELQPQVGEEHQLPLWVTISVIVICITPFILQGFGLDFGNHPDPGKATSTVDEMFYRLSGGFTHALLEWTAVCAAIFVVVLAFSHYSINHDVTTPVIGVALFCAGIMDAFHTLAATRLITAVADNQDLIPFTWALSRIFNAVIMLVGVGIFLTGKQISPKKGIKFIALISISFALIGYILIYLSATSTNLPQTQFPDAFITRPYDVIPLVLFLIAGLFVFPLFLKRHPSIFASALLLSALPEIVVELHMAFGSTRLFDSNFNSAHFLKILAYAVPLIGLTLDYIQTSKKLVENHESLQHAHHWLNTQANELKIINSRLSQSNDELEKFAYIASHDLQEPLRKIQAFGDRLQSSIKNGDNNKSLDYIDRMQKASLRMRSLIDDLLQFSRVSSQEIELQTTSLSKVIGNVILDLKMNINDKQAKIEISDLPPVNAESVMMYQLFLNLLSNALKFTQEGQTPIIKITAKEVKLNQQTYIQISVRDNGIGFEQEYAQKIFEVFQRLHGRGEYQGTGIGLAICKKIMDKHHGKIEVESKLGEGTCFQLYFAHGKKEEPLYA